MRKDDRVEFHAMWSSFFGLRGKVVSTTPRLMVLIDGDRHPVAVGDREVRQYFEAGSVTWVDE